MLKRTMKIASVVLALVMVLSLFGCAQPAEEPAEPAKVVETEKSDEPKEEAKEAEPVTIKLFTNLPDRTAGQGLLEQTLIDNYLAENPNVTIEIEALQDEPYKQKFKAYTSSDNLPDVVSVWGQPAFIDPVINSGYLAELDSSHYLKSGYEFLPGSLNGFSKDGKLYGLPRNTDIMVFYYNKAIFKDNGIEVPASLDELIAISEKLDGTGIAPCSMTGKDKWPIAILFTDFALKYTGDNSLLKDGVANQDLSAAGIQEAAKAMEKLNASGFYQKSFTSADYGAGRNMFAQGKAATYYMGSWEMGMVNDESLPEEIRNNIGLFVLPAIEGASGSVTDIAAWNGGGHAVSAKSEVKEEAIKLLNYIYAPENWAKNAWQMGLCIPAQKFDAYLTGDETSVQNELTEILSNATSVSGTPVNDLGSPAFKIDAEDLSQQFAAGMIDAEEYITKLNEALQ